MRNKIFLAILLSIGMMSCNKWLDVKPSAQLPEDEIFADEQGYNDLMRGVYTGMSEKPLYGEKLTISFMDVIARRYSNTVTNTFHGYYFSAYHQYSETQVRLTINGIWSGMYARVAQLNLLLSKIDGGRNVFATEAAYKKMKAEATGLRAFLHFDLLRMFAPSYVVDPQYKAIPYMKDFTVKPAASLTTTAVIDSCLSDLATAEAMMADTTVGNGYTFNIWAVRATMARIYLYKGDKANALVYAKKVIDGKNFRFVNAAEVNAANPDRVLPMECIFSLYTYGLNTTSDIFFTETANGIASPNNSYLLVPDATIKTVYENAVQGYGGDPRYKLWWVAGTGSVTRYMAKFYKIATASQYRMPLIRLSEMYLVAAEAAPDVATANAYMDAYKVTGRFLPAAISTTSAQVLTEIGKEYVKEYYGEGQLFYYYKRNNIQVPAATATGNALFVFPIPEDEIEFRS